MLGWAGLLLCVLYQVHYLDVDSKSQCIIPLKHNGCIKGALPLFILKSPRPLVLTSRYGTVSVSAVCCATRVDSIGILEEISRTIFFGLLYLLAQEQKRGKITSRHLQLQPSYVLGHSTVACPPEGEEGVHPPPPGWISRML